MLSAQVSVQILLNWDSNDEQRGGVVLVDSFP